MDLELKNKIQARFVKLEEKIEELIRAVNILNYPDYYLTEDEKIAKEVLNKQQREKIWDILTAESNQKNS